jgi:hypothetical protein
MDEELGAGGVVGRDGKVRELVKQRLRADDKLRIALQDYVASARAVESTGLGGDPLGRDVPAGRASRPEDLPAQIAHEHGQAAIELVTPVSFSARSFLLALVVTTDPSIDNDVKMASARLCTQIVEREGRAHCVCMATWSARDEHEFRDWIDEARDAGLPADEDDVGLAALVREYGRGRGPDDPPVHPSIRRTLDEVVSFELARTGGAPDDWAEEDRRIARVARDRLIQSLWATALSPRQTKARHRLDAYKELEGAQALRKCVCAPKRWVPEFPPVAPEIDDYNGTIRLLARRTHRSALVVVRFPETYNALREMLDGQIVAAAAESVVFARDGTLPG